MEQATSDVMRDVTYEQDLIKRRALIAEQFMTLPSYGSTEFWQRIEESQSKQALPLEVLVKCIRLAIHREDGTGKVPGIYPSDAQDASQFVVPRDQPVQPLAG